MGLLRVGVQHGSNQVPLKEVDNNVNIVRPDDYIEISSNKLEMLVN